MNANILRKLNYLISLEIKNTISFPSEIINRLLYLIIEKKKLISIAKH
jgi:hypothetical protein